MFDFFLIALKLLYLGYAVFNTLIAVVYSIFYQNLDNIVRAFIEKTKFLCHKSKKMGKTALKKLTRYTPRPNAM